MTDNNSKRIRVYLRSFGEDVPALEEIIDGLPIDPIDGLGGLTQEAIEASRATIILLGPGADIPAAMQLGALSHALGRTPIVLADASMRPQLSPAACMFTVGFTSPRLAGSMARAIAKMQ